MKNIDFNYEIIFKGATEKTRCIEIKLLEYNHSQFILIAPLGSGYLWGYTEDDFFRSHKDLTVNVNKLCEEIAYQHLWFLMCWDLKDKDNAMYSYKAWNFWLKEWQNQVDNFKPNEKQLKLAKASYYIKYEREKGKRTYKCLGYDF